MQYVDFLGQKVSKIICGDNPFNGHSYITNYIPGDEMKFYHTMDKILEALHRMEEMGINTILPLADMYITRILKHYRRNGGKMNFIFQTFAPFMVNYEAAAASIRDMVSLDPLGIYLSGTYTDVRFETGKTHEIVGMLNFLKTAGCPIGFGSHVPENILHCEENHWGADFYMACMYNLRRGREGQESGFLTGKSKSGVVVVPEDRAVALEALKKIDKPIIAFKIFAGGQMLVETEEQERRALIKDTYNTIFTALKPNDIAVMGVYQKNHDQIAENVSVFNEWAAEQK